MPAARPVGSAAWDRSSRTRDEYGPSFPPAHWCANATNLKVVPPFTRFVGRVRATCGSCTCFSLFGALSEQIVAAPEKRNLEGSNFGSVQSQMVRQHVEKRGAVRAQPSATEA